MFSLKTMIKAYAKFITNGQDNVAEEVSFDIYEELIDEAHLMVELADKDYVMDYFTSNFSEITNPGILNLLADYINGYANADLDSEDDEVELGETPMDKLVLVQHSLDLEEGSKNSEVLPYIFDSIDDIDSYVEFKLDIEELEEKLMQIDRGTIGVQFADRDSMYDSLMASEMVESEVIADNLPETCVGVNLLLSFDLKKERIVKAVILAAYEMSEYPTI